MNARVAFALTLCLGCARTPATPPPATAPTESARAAPPPAAPSLRVLTQADPSATLVNVRVVFESGSADDPAGKEGATRLAARWMAEGGTRDLSYEEVTRALFPMAARVSFYVDRDMTVFEGQVHRDHLERFYPIFRDLIVAPRLADADLDRVRRQTVADLTLDLRGSSDEALGQEALQSLIYRGHPYGHPALGTEAGLAALTADDLRAQREGVFCAGRVVVGLGGALPEGLEATVRRDFGALPQRCAERAPLPTPSAPSGMQVVIIDKPRAAATAISYGWPVEVTRRDAGFAALDFSANYLGLHRQSVGVLYQTIREARGLNYGDYMYAEHFVQQPDSRFPRPNVLRRQQYASVWIRPVPPPAATFALRASLRAIQRVIDGGVPEADITRVRDFLGGYVGLYAQTGMVRLGYAIDDLLLGAELPFAERMRAGWAPLTSDALRDALRRSVSTRNVYVAVVAPNASALAEIIGHNGPAPVTYESPKPPEVMAEDQEINAFALSATPETVHVTPVAELFARGTREP